MAIGVVEFDLSMVDPDTGLYNTARAYTVEGVTNPDGSLRELSIGQLVMALCLQRATELESDIVRLMQGIENTSATLEAMTAIESAIIDAFQADTSMHVKGLGDLNSVTMQSGQTLQQFIKDISPAGVTPPWDDVVDFLRRGMGILDGTQIYVRNDKVISNLDILYDDFMEKIEAKMDEKNSFSQKTMIELQSQTNKRDQSYDMISNILKSLNNVLIGNVNNM